METLFRFILCPQASLKHWLGLDHSMTSVRQSLEGLESTMQRLEGSESGEGVIPQVKVNDITFAGIPVRVYEPPAGGEGNVRRGLMYFHGGGWALGSGSEYKWHIFNHLFLNKNKPNNIKIKLSHVLFPHFFS